jgi:hypothetical protein
MLGGVAGIAACLVAGADTTTSTSSAADAISSVSAICLWIWMLAVGIMLWRRTSVSV